MWDVLNPKFKANSRHLGVFLEKFQQPADRQLFNIALKIKSQNLLYDVFVSSSKSRTVVKKWKTSKKVSITCKEDLTQFLNGRCLDEFEENIFTLE